MSVTVVGTVEGGRTPTKIKPYLKKAIVNLACHPRPLYFFNQSSFKNMQMTAKYYSTSTSLAPFTSSVTFMDKNLVDDQKKLEKNSTIDSTIESSFIASEGSADTAQMRSGIESIQMHRLYDSNRSDESLNQSRIPEEDIPVGDCSLASSRLDGEHNIKLGSIVAQELMCKISEKINKNIIVTEEEIISDQSKSIIKKSTNFCWPSIQNLNAAAHKGKCGWCFSCKVANDDRDCIYLAVSGLQTDIFKVNFRAAWIITVIVIVAFLAKIIVVILPGYYYKVPMKDCVVIGLVLNGRDNLNLTETARDSLPSPGAVVIEAGKKAEEQLQKWIRVQEFDSWIWNSFYLDLNVVKYGKRSYLDSLGRCRSCHDLYWRDERHCKICHMTFELDFDLEEKYAIHIAMCREKEDSSTFPNHKVLSSQIQSLKAATYAIKFVMPEDALVGAWRKSARNLWIKRLRRTSTLVELLQVLADFVGAIHKG
ncbi:hypothetical protein KIW84_074926 [Lathyrus oleraceus]|uniref:Uncharacterized protein n=1 Tax=Pisum sativum TaxID=3888 RepID=A0A9D5A0I3_PEA|nr:hypothetical protein KIW84_074926 [Pisum sativum]